MNSNLIVMITADRKIDRRILLEADSLESAGWRLKIIAMPADPDDVDTDPRVVRIGVDSRLNHRVSFFLHTYHWIRQRVPQDGWLMRTIKAIAWRYAVDQELFFLKLFSSTISQFSPDVFVAHDLPMLPVAKRASQCCQAKLVYDSHELYCEQEFSNYEKRRLQQIEAKHIGACDAVITINPSVANELEQRYNIRRVHIIYNAERSGFNPKRKRHFNETFSILVDQKVILFQGGLSAGRNLEKLVDGMAHVRNKTLNLVIMGNGRLWEKLSKKIQNLGLSERVHLHAAVPQDQLIAVTACADIGVIPYQATCLNNYYCTPNKLFEFIAAGIPILSSDLPEIRNLIETHEIGLVGDLSTPEKVAQQIDDFFSNPKRIKQWQDNVMKARQIVCWEKESQKLIKIFDQLK